MKKLWFKQTVLFLTGQTITLLGSAIVQYAITWHITLTTKSGLMLTYATLFGFLPQILVSLFAGVWADRFDRKKMIIFADGLIALFTALLAVLFAIGYDYIWLLFLISGIRSIGAGIQSPAVGAYLTEFVPQDKLLKVNGINASIQSMMFLFAPVVAGGLYSFMGLGPIFSIDVMTAAIGILLLTFLRVPPRAKSTQQQENIFKEMFSGLRYVFSTQWIRQFLGFYLFYSLMFGPVVFLTPLMVARSFGDEPWRLVAHEMVFAGGSIVGGLLIGLASKKISNKTHMLILASFVFGLGTLIMGFSTNFWFYLGIMFPLGLTVPFINTSSMTVLQQRVEPSLMGRVFSLTSIIGSAAMPLSMAFFGPLADFVPVETQLIITGGLMAVIALVATRFKAMRAAGELNTIV